MLATLEEFHFQLSVLRLAALFDMEPGAYTDAAELIGSEINIFKAYRFNFIALIHFHVHS